MREQTLVIKEDLDNMEEMENLRTDANVLAELLYHYFYLRIEGIDGTPGFAPEKALQETLTWSRRYERKVA